MLTRPIIEPVAYLHCACEFGLRAHHRQCLRWQHMESCQNEAAKAKGFDILRESIFSLVECGCCIVIGVWCGQNFEKKHASALRRSLQEAKTEAA